MSQTKAQLIDPVDGTIVNADINASAAIAGSKISPSFTSDITITDVNPALLLVDSNNNSDYELGNQDGLFRLRDTTNTSNRLVVDSSGNVGIGTSTPATLLHMRASSAPKLRIDDSDTSGVFTLEQDGADGSVLLSSAGTLSIGVTNDNAAATLTFLTRNNERLRLDSSGRMLLGTTTEGVANASKFTIADTQHCGMTIRSGTSHDGQVAFSDGTSGDDEFRGQIRYNHGSNFLAIATNAVERMRIDSSGNVGIGTTPNERLVVSGNAGVTGALFITGNTSTPSAGAFLYRPADNTLAFGSNSAERVRITNGGFLYVNKTSSSDFGRFEVKGGTADDIETSDIRTETVATFSGSSPGTTASGKGVGIVIKPIADRGCNFFIGVANSSSNQEAHGSLIFRSGNFASATAERLRIDQNGHLLPGADNSLNLGSDSKRWANLYTTDLKLSNEGSQNDVDSTWGNYTIQEGYEDLFLINHRTGKKFKFNLTEVA